MAGGRKKRVPDYKRRALEKGRAVAKMKREIAKELKEKEASEGRGVGGVEESGIIGSIKNIATATSSSRDPSASEHGGFGFEQESTASHLTQGSVLESTSMGSNVRTPPCTEMERGEGGGNCRTENTDSALETTAEEAEFVPPVFFLDGSLQAELKGHAVDLLGGPETGSVSEVVEELELEIAHEEEVGTIEVGTEILDLDTYSRIVEHGPNQADITMSSTKLGEQVPGPSINPDESRIKLPIRKRKFKIGDIKLSKRNASCGSRPAPLHIKTRRMAEEDDLGCQLQPGRMYDDLIPKDGGANILFPLRKGAPHCLVCYQKRPHPLAHPPPPDATTSISFETETPPLIQNLQTIFVLRKLLELPPSIVQQFLLETEKHPKEWIGLCPECKLLVHKCFDVNEKIVSLLGELREHKEKIIRKIKKTHHRDMFNRERLNCLTCTRIPCPGHSNIQVTNETREYVYYKNYSCLSTMDLDNEAQQHYESQLKEVERLAKDSEVTKLLKAREVELATAAAPTPSIPCLVLLNQDMAQSDNAGNVETETEHETQNISEEKKKRGPKRKAEAVDKYKYICSSCSSLPAMTLDEFIGHIMFHHKRPYKCVECSMHLPKDEESVVKHWNKVHLEASLNEEPLIKYSEVHFVPGEIWTCKEKGCQQKFSSLGLRKEHEESAHSPIKYWRYGEQGIKPEVCRLCFMKFPSNEEWRLHRVIDHPTEAEMECKFCDKSFITKTKEGVEITDLPRLRAHLKKVHNKGSGFALNICDWCGQTFRSSSMLKQHLFEMHNLEGNHLSCQVCRKTFPTRATLSSHKRSVHFEKRFTCEVCGLSSMARSYFLEHKFKLHKIRPKDGTSSFKCSYSACRYESYVPNKLQSHLRRHTDSRPHTCKQCGKGFYDRKHYNAHERIHAGTKPFRCETCGKTFAVQNYLYIHQRLSHQGRLFPSSTRKNTKAKGKKDKTKKSKSKQLSSLPSANIEITTEPIALNPNLDEQHTITYVQVVDEQTVNIEVQQS